MKRSSESPYKNALYIISTPIGNLSDISKRAIDTFKMLDFLFCEDTRVSGKLLSYLGIKIQTDSFHDFSDKDKEDKILSLLMKGLNVGLVSDAGTPIISDPGYEAVSLAISHGFRVIPIPGATAEVTALTISSLPPKPYLFYGFLEHKKEARATELTSLKDYPFTMVFYESPLRIKNTLKEMYQIFGERKAALSRELTKIYEETIYLNLSEYLSLPDDLKGEMVLSVHGKEKEESHDIDIILEMHKIIKDGFSVKEASKLIAEKTNLKASFIYNEFQKEKEK